jgi:carbon-monoxide dehydrogenase large subunit
VTGAAQFVGDVDRPGQLWARIVRSPFAHGRLRSVDLSPALASPGVVDAFSAADLPELRIPIRLPFAETPSANEHLQPPLARDTVRYVGEPIAVVVAETAAAAEDAAELVIPEIDIETPIVDVVAGAVVERVPMRYGDVDAAFADAAVVVRRTLRMHRHTGVPLETRGLVAELDDGRLTVWGAAKVKHFNRAVLAEMLGMPADALRLVEVNVGGAFGVRGEFYPEDYLVPVAARRTGRAVKWIEDRYEHFVATNHAREQVHEIEVAAAADGRLLAFRDRAWCDQGAYVRTQGILPALLPAMHLPGPYAWDAFEIESIGVTTNRTPVGTYRGPGATEATFVRERMLDVVARQLGIDPVEIRRRNLIPGDRMPFVYDFGPAAPPLVYETGDFRAFFERLLEESGHEQLRSERGPGTGVGVAAFVEVGGVGPFEHAWIVPQDGRYRVRVGVASVGQGVETVLAQIAADELGVPLDEVCVEYHDTDDVPEGFGAFASRSTVLAGNAVAVAARDLRQKAGRDLAGAAAELAAAGLRGEGTFEKENPSFSFGANLSLVAVDEVTGKVTPLRHAVAFDVGRAINPVLVHGQLAGAAAQGIAGALYEELVYDDDGNPLTTSFLDYQMPTAAELPAVEVIAIEHPTPTNPLGIKGAGEAGMNGAPAAVANAVADALSLPEDTLASLPLSAAAVHALVTARES